MADLSNVRFSKSHEWLRVEGDTGVVGITDHAQNQLGDVIFVELPEVGSTVSAGDRYGTVESVKAASDLYAPASGTVSEVNSALESSPELVNSDPYGDGWMIKISNPEPAGDLMDEAGYNQLAG